MTDRNLQMLEILAVYEGKKTADMPPARLMGYKPTILAQDYASAGSSRGNILLIA